MAEHSVYGGADVLGSRDLQVATDKLEEEMYWVLTADELEELLQLERRGGEVAPAEALREQEPRKPPGHGVRDEVALQRHQRGPRRHLVGPLGHGRCHHAERPSLCGCPKTACWSKGEGS